MYRAGTRLFEAEGRLLKREIINLLLLAGIGLVVVLLVTSGLGFIFFSLFSILAGPLTSAGATAVLGAASLLLAWGGFVWFSRMAREETSVFTDSERAVLAQSKSELDGAISAVDPLASLRQRPYACVTVAALLGALTALSEQRIASALRRSKMVSSVLYFIVLAAMRFAAGFAAGSARPPAPQATARPDGAIRP